MDNADLMTLHRRYAATRDPRLREILVEGHVGLARPLAERFAHRGAELDDLVQVAFCGLLKAIERYDPDRGARFAAFATPTIIGELKRHFRDCRWNVRVPRSIQENFLDVRETTEMLRPALGRSPAVVEVARCTGLSVEAVVEAFDAGATFRPLSLDDTSQPRRPLAEDLVARPSPEMESADDRAEVASLLSQLPARERQILWLRFGLDLTQRQIGARLGISQMHLSRLLARTLDRCRASARQTGHAA